MQYNFLNNIHTRYVKESLKCNFIVYYTMPAVYFSEESQDSQAVIETFKKPNWLSRIDYVIVRRAWRWYTWRSFDTKADPLPSGYIINIAYLHVRSHDRRSNEINRAPSFSTRSELLFKSAEESLTFSAALSLSLLARGFRSHCIERNSSPNNIRNKNIFIHVLFGHVLLWNYFT